MVAAHARDVVRGNVTPASRLGLANDYEINVSDYDVASCSLLANENPDENSQIL